jgi:hypothetical protein
MAVAYQRGLVAWMRVRRRALPAPPAPPPARSCGQPQPIPGAEQQLVDLLASMALSAARG